MIIEEISQRTFPVVIITGVSASWKTTLQQELLRRGWERPYNFTTRQSRWDWEQEEYIFLTKEAFINKISRGEFLENTNYWGNFYWVSKYLPEGKTCIVLDPVGRAQVSEYFVRNNIPFKTFYLEISPTLQEQRLRKRKDSQEEIDKRAKDFQWFSPTNKCEILDGNTDSILLADKIEEVLCEY